MGPKPKPRPQQWSLEKAKQAQASVKVFDEEPPVLRMPKERQRANDGKFKGKAR